MENNGIPGPEEYLDSLEKLLNKSKFKKKFYEAIVNAPFHNRFQTTVLGLGFLAFLLVNEKTGMIDRISISDNELARGAINMTDTPFEDMKVPVNQPDNLVATAIATGKNQQTTDWHLLTVPALSAEASRFNQAAAGVSSAVVYPLENDKIKGAIIYQFYVPMNEIETAHHNFMRHYTHIVSSALGNRAKN
jgi:hypothetical protein